MGNNILTYDAFLALFPDKPRSKAGNGWLVLCPAHNDHSPSLWIRPSDNPDFIATWDCKAGSCTREDVLKALHLTWKDVRIPKLRSADTINGKPRNSGTPPSKVENSDSKTAEGTVPPTPEQCGTPETGLTLNALSDAKHLPVDFLKSLGISEAKKEGVPYLKIPYPLEDGTEIALRYRSALFGARFSWRKGDHALPYGLNKLEMARKAGWILVVEGESDCWTAWFCGIPAIGAPGKNIWPSKWGEFLAGLDVYLWQEPDAQDFTLRVLESAPNLRYIVAPTGIKDISEAHIQGMNLPVWLEELKSKAERGQELKARIANAQLASVYESAKPVIEADDPLELVKKSIREMGYGGDLQPVLITYLAVTSRVLEMRPGTMMVHLLLMGPPSAGKSYTVGQVLKLLPRDSYHVIDAGSPRTIIYDNSDLKHKVVIFSEADSLPAGEDNPAASAIRNMLQDHHLHYQVTIRDSETGDFTIREVDKPGPTVLITTSTKSLGAQLMTRLFTLEVSDSEEQIGAALETQAMLEAEGSKSPDHSLEAFQLYLQLKAPIKVLVPFARELATAMRKVIAAPRILRDFARLMSLIKSAALIRQHHRKVDGKGQIVATMDDYRTVRELVNAMYIDSSPGITNEVRKLVEAVTELNKERKEDERVTASKLKEHLGISKAAISRRANKAIREEWLINKESRKGYPADYVPGDPMPDTEGLPSLEELSRFTVSTVPPPPKQSETPILDSKEGDRSTVSPLTVDDAPHLENDSQSPETGKNPVEHLRLCHPCGDLKMHRLISDEPSQWQCLDCQNIVED